jgi:hypothetical protein
MSPRMRHALRQRNGWTDEQREHLSSGHDFFGSGWGNSARMSQAERERWPSAEVEAEMRAAWEDLRESIMDERRDSLTRPWAWWVFEKGYPIRGCHFCGHHDQAETLDAMGELTETALLKASVDEQVTRGILNDAHESAFRRRWGWWRFTSPERRDPAIPEAVQLVQVENNGGEVLTDREKYIVKHKADVPAYTRGCPKVLLTSEECERLGLPDTFIDPYED